MLWEIIPLVDSPVAERVKSDVESAALLTNFILKPSGIDIIFFQVQEIFCH